MRQCWISRVHFTLGQESARLGTQLGNAVGLAEQEKEMALGQCNQFSSSSFGRRRDS